MKSNCRMELLDLSVAQVQRRHVLSLLPPLGQTDLPPGPNRWLVAWLLIGSAFTILLTWMEIGGQP